MQSDAVGEGPSKMSLVGDTQGGKTTILQHLLVHGLISIDQYSKMHFGDPIPAELLEAYKHLR